MAILALRTSTGPVQVQAQSVTGKVAMYVGAAGRVYLSVTEAEDAAAQHPAGGGMSAPVDVQRLRNDLAWCLLMERGASRRARHFERRANNPRNPNRAASARVAAGYQGDAAKDRHRIAELRAELASVKGGAA